MHGIEQAGRMITGPALEQIRIIFGVVIGITNHTVEEHAEVKAFPRCPKIQTCNHFRIVRTQPYTVVRINRTVIVSIHVFDTSYSGSAKLYIIFGFILIHLLLGTEHSICLEAHP